MEGRENEESPAEAGAPACFSRGPGRSCRGTEAKGRKESQRSNSPGIRGNILPQPTQFTDRGVAIA